MIQRDTTAESVIKRLSDIQHHLHESLAPYEEFLIGGKTYYFTPGGFLYRKEPGAEEVGGFFCGYLSDEVWPCKTDTVLGKPERKVYEVYIGPTTK